MTAAGTSSAPLPSADALPLAFARQLDEAFARAAAAADPISLTLGIAGRSVKIVLAGTALVPFVKGALAPRLTRRAEGPPDLVINLWDSRTTGVAAPRPPGPPAMYGARGEIRGGADGRVFAACSHSSGSLSALDVESKTGFFWVRDAEDLAVHEFGAPLLALFGRFFRAEGAQLVHAAAVGRGGEAVLLAGRGGSGKSTTSLACLGAGLDHIADDYALLEGGPSPSVHALYATAKLNGDSLSRLPHFAPAVTNAAREPGEKALLDLGSAPGIRLAAKGSLRAIVLPRVAPGGAEAPMALSPIAPGEALRALAPSTIFQMAGAGASTFVSLAALVKTVPAFRLDLGPDLSAVAARVASLLPPA